MPVCIAGMARSGTSLCTRALNLCGLSLGDEADLLPPGPDNPDGFWENTRFVEINEALLSMFGGAWDCPPVIPLEDDSEQFARLHAKAGTTLESFAGQEPWGWKDPRNSLTLPFWRQYFPEMKVVICLRNPLEVAQSLYRRSWYSTELSLTLWYVYNQRLLGAIPPEQRIVTHYDAYFADPEAEIRRLLDFLGMPAGEKRLAQACTALSRGLRHHHFTTQHLYDVNVAPAVLDLYAAMCREAGDVAADLVHVADDPTADSATSFLAPGAGGGAGDRARRGVRDTRSGPQGDDGQLGIAMTSVGRLDRAALDVIVLRDEVRALNAVVSAASEEREQLRAHAEALERELALLREEHERRGAYIETLEGQREADRAADAELRSYVREVEQQITAAHADHAEIERYARTLEGQLDALNTVVSAANEEQERLRARGAALERELALLHEEHRLRGAYIETLEGQLRAAAEERQQLRTYAHALEEQCQIAQAHQQELVGYARTLEAALAAAQRDHERRGEYAAMLERQIGAAQADHEQSAAYTREIERQLAAAQRDHEGLTTYATTLEQQVAAAQADHEQSAEYMRGLERQLAAAYDDHAKLDAWAKTLIMRLEILEAASGERATYIADLERQLTALRDDLRRLTALARTPIPAAMARLRTFAASLARRFRRARG